MRPDKAELRSQIDRAAGALADGLAAGDLSRFYDTFRSTDLPFLGLAYEDDALGLFRACFEVLHRFGGLSPAVALAIENHFYVSSSIATFPIGDDPRLDARRRTLLRSIVDGRLLVANTNSRIHTDKLGTMGTRARREGSGFRVTGTASYTSLASQGDILLFVTKLEGEGPALFVTRMKGDPRVEVGPLLFPRAMIDSDTRQITFRELFLPEEGLILGGKDPRVLALLTFEMVWHQVLIPSLYLGAAASALDEVRRFARAVRARDDKPLAELDGVVVDVGRLAIRYLGARSVVFQAGEALGAVATSEHRVERLAEAFDLASAAKYLGTECAEEIVTAARRIIGARAFKGDHPIERLSEEVMFGALGPEVNAFIERRHGGNALGERRFEDRLR